MNKLLLNRLLILLVCGALFFTAFILPLQASQQDVCKDSEQRPNQEIPGTQLLWESLSHQFLSSVQY